MEIDSHIRALRVHICLGILTNDACMRRLPGISPPLAWQDSLLRGEGPSMRTKLKDVG